MNTSVLSSLMTRWLSRRALASWVAAVVLATAFGSATAGGKPYSYFVTGNAEAR
jgi:H+/gluconate symporter-like permease